MFSITFLVIVINSSAKEFTGKGIIKLAAKHETGIAKIEQSMFLTKISSVKLFIK